LLLAACGSGDDDDDGVMEGPEWALLHDAEPAALLSVWGTSADDVWVVGGRTPEAGPALLHHDAGSWERIDVGQPDIDLWSVFGFAGGDIYFGGSDGRILRYRDGAFEVMTTPPGGPVFGLWGPSEDSVWAAGGDGQGGGVVWHLEGDEWVDVALPEGVFGQMFKVHGQTDDDVWFSGDDGVTLHWNGSALEPVDSGTGSPLFSIVTKPDVVIAVGGVPGTSEILENTGEEGWSAAEFSAPLPWRGTAAGDGELAFVVGEQGAVAERSATGWTALDQPLIDLDFHAAWVDPEGGLWGVGGRFDSGVFTTEGFLLYRGRSSVAEVVP
jgi:hypothetical protein